MRRRGGRKRALGTRAAMLPRNGRMSAAHGLHLSRSGYSEKQRRRLCRSPRERRPKEQTTDATGTAVLESQFRGYSQTLLYNHNRPHSRLGWLSPAIYAAQRRSAALRSTDGSAPRTAATTAQPGTTNGQIPIATG